MRFSANLGFLWPDRPFLQRFAAARAAGFAGVEFPFLGDHDPRDVAERLAEHQLELALFNTPPGDAAAGDWGTLADPRRRREFRDIFSATLELAQVWRCARVHTLFANRIADLDPARQMETALENLAWALPLARAAGVTLTLEPLNNRDFPTYFLSTTARALEIVRTIDDPSLRLQIDLYHAHRAGEDLMSTLEAAAPFAGHMQIADLPDRGDPGSGEVDFAAIFARLRALGYDGWIGLEYRPQRPPAEILRELRALDLT